MQNFHGNPPTSTKKVISLVKVEDTDSPKEVFQKIDRALNSILDKEESKSVALRLRHQKKLS
jgi:hypothetical protein